jgi:hypothetical protein
VRAPMDRAVYMKAYRARHKQASKRVDIVVDLKHWRKLERAAQKADISTTAAITELLLKELAKMSQNPAPLVGEIEAVSKPLKRVADRVNMLAHHANTVHRVVDEQGVLDELQRAYNVLYEGATRLVHSNRNQHSGNADDNRSP